MSVLYGIDLEKSEVTPIDARNALIECFGQAHCTDSGLDVSDKATTKDYITEIIKKAFTDSGGDYENPTKESILQAMNQLQEFSKNFRDQSIIQNHANQMMKIVDKLK